MAASHIPVAAPNDNPEQGLGAWVAGRLAERHGIGRTTTDWRALAADPARAGARSHFRAMGIDPDRLTGPIVGIASTWTATMPCNLTHRELAAAAERSGLVPSEEWALTKRKARWYPSETISVSIGQGPILVTPLQIARALSGLVEGGRLPTPHLFLAGQDPRTGRRLRYTPEWRAGTALAPEKLAIVKDGMFAVLNEPGGTAYLSRGATPASARRSESR